MELGKLIFMEVIMVRRIRTDDCENIRKICVEELGYECERGLIEARVNELDENREAVFVAESDNRIVGFIHVEKYKVLYFEDMANILGLAIAKNYQRCGFGKELLKEAEQWAENNNIHMMRLNSGMKRTEAHKFYRAMNFLNEKDQKRFIKRL
jgi:GNAT superfamily N-acetyltransferase